ncbi:MAG: putative membrane protein YdfK [Firmicutes bacterium ADurb.Bin182]|nr:MAG: putative membrane protein YdfK [Firmicutes bacterium ADurb.Bin182]
MFIGAIVNFAAVLTGSAIGLLFKSKLNPKYHDALIKAMALGVAAIGISYSVKTENILIMIVSLLLGTLTGTFLKIDERLEKLGDRLQSRFKYANNGFSEGFAGASILYCVGSMAIMGCIDSGLHQNNDILFTKSLIDAVTSVFLASALGIGVLFSAFSVLIYEGLLTLFFALFAGNLELSVITEMSAAGGVILMGIAVNMLKLGKIKTADMVLSLFMPVAVVPLLNLINLA